MTNPHRRRRSVHCRVARAVGAFVVFGCAHQAPLPPGLGSCKSSAGSAPEVGSVVTADAETPSSDLSLIHI